MEPTRLLEHLRGETGEILSLLRSLVEHESPTPDKPAVDAVGQFVAGQYRSLGIPVEVLERAGCGNHLRVSWGDGDEQILLLAHLDTVLPVGTIDSRPFRVEDDRAYGPGVNDDKGGVLIALWALRTMVRLGLRPRKRVVILHNGDEEGGSRDSRSLIEAEACRSSQVLVLEVSTDTGAVKTARRGGGTFRLKVSGRAAHAGNDLARGVNAIEELSHQVVALQALTDHERGIAVNVGIVSGGTKASVVPDKAEVAVYFRTWTNEDLAALQRQVNELQPRHPGASLAVEWGAVRPPFRRTEAGGALYESARRLAEEMGLPLEEAAAGAGSDGNFAAATGTPTLDGLGPVGAGSHAEHEYVSIPGLPERIALLVRLLQTL